jgi:hypothetical protein
MQRYLLATRAFFFLGALTARLPFFVFFFVFVLRDRFGAADEGAPGACVCGRRRASSALFCADSPRRAANISRALTSGDLFAAMSVMILPPVRNASRPSALIPFHRRGLTVRKSPLKNCLYRYRVVGREKSRILVLPHL